VIVKAFPGQLHQSDIIEFHSQRNTRSYFYDYAPGHSNLYPFISKKKYKLKNVSMIANEINYSMGTGSEIFFPNQGDEHQKSIVRTQFSTY
jgi:hypothetical protein